MSRIWSAVVEGFRRVAALSDQHVLPTPPVADFLEDDFEAISPNVATERAIAFLRSLHIYGCLTERKGRLVAVFITEYIGPKHWDDETPSDLERALRLAEGTLPEADRKDALVRRGRLGYHFRQGPNELAHALLNWSGVQAAYHTLTHFGYRVPTLHEQIGTPGVDHFFRLVRDAFPPNEWSQSFDPSWQTEAVLDLANHCFQSNDFSALPILGDLLEEAGCADESILNHCRGPDEHIRGCWVVDLVLGKS